MLFWTGTWVRPQPQALQVAQETVAWAQPTHQAGQPYWRGLCSVWPHAEYGEKHSERWTEKVIKSKPAKLTLNTWGAVVHKAAHHWRSPLRAWVWLLAAGPAVHPPLQSLLGQGLLGLARPHRWPTLIPPGSALSLLCSWPSPTGLSVWLSISLSKVIVGTGVLYLQKKTEVCLIRYLWGMVSILRAVECPIYNQSLCTDHCRCLPVYQAVKQTNTGQQSRAQWSKNEPKAQVSLLAQEDLDSLCQLEWVCRWWSPPPCPSPPWPLPESPQPTHSSVSAHGIPCAHFVCMWSEDIANA